MTAEDDSVTEIDVEAWRQRIRQDTFARYHVSMGQAIRSLEQNLPVAIEHFQRAIAIDAGNLAAHLHLITALSEAGRADEAEAARAAARTVDPDYETGGLRRIALDALEHFDYEEAAGAFAEIQRRAPDPAYSVYRFILRLLMAEEVAVEDYKEVFDSLPAIPDEVNDIIFPFFEQFAECFYLDERLELARLCYQYLASNDPGNYGALIRLGGTSLLLGEVGDAVRIARLGHALRPDVKDNNAIWLEILSLEVGGSTAEAEPTIKSIVAVTPESSDGYCLLAKNYRLQGRQCEAEVQFSRADVLSSYSNSSYWLAVTCMARFVHDSPAEIRHRLDRHRAAEARPTEPSPTMRVIYGMTSLVTGDPAGAEADFRDALGRQKVSIDFFRPAARLGLRASLIAQGRTDEAEAIRRRHPYEDGHWKRFLTGLVPALSGPGV